MSGASGIPETVSASAARRRKARCAAGSLLSVHASASETASQTHPCIADLVSMAVECSSSDPDALTQAVMTTQAITPPTSAQFCCAS